MDELSLQKKLHVIPYVPGIAEYAAKVREKILDLEDKDFILAVDLPHGLEYNVMTATKKLPSVSVIVDQLFRGIPVIPTSAPIEAVPCFLETGVDLKFIDTSLPVAGNLDDYRYFIEQCRLSGIEVVIKNAEKYGISPNDLLKSWIDSFKACGSRPSFCHLPEMVEEMYRMPWSDDSVSPYLKTRLQYMAQKVRELLETDSDVMLVCSVDHLNGILHFLREPIGEVDDSYIVPSKICAIGEEDIQKITSEIPFFMYQYELYRDTPVDRQRWITNTFCGIGEKTVRPDIVRAMNRYAYNLALTDQEVFPDMYNLIATAKYCVNDEYAYKVYQLLKSYPPSEHTASECSLHNILNYNFQPLASTRYLSIKVSIFNDSPEIRRIRQKIQRSSNSNDYYRFTRSPRSIQAEREFMKYMTCRFTALQKSEDNFEVHEFVSGFYDGIDVRETIRQKPSNIIYIREPVIENQTGYVLDYRSVPVTDLSTGSVISDGPGSFPGPINNRTRFCSSKIFLDKNYPWVGLASSNNNHYTCGMMLAFAGINKDPIPMMDEISYSNPLESAVATGIRHAKQVFVFTDFPSELEGKFPDKKNIRILQTSAIPAQIFKKMHEFDIEYKRYDNCRGD
jgi:hypothetical protein